MPDNLADTARAAGLIDPDLLRLADPDMGPAAAVADLRKRYPSAFVGDIRGATRADADAAMQSLLDRDGKWRALKRQAHIDAEMAKPDVRGLTNAEVDARLKNYLRGLA